MSRQILLLFSVTVLFTAYLIHNVDGQSPWEGPKNCTTYKCPEEEGSTLEACTTKYGDRAKFYPNGGYCNCNVCQKILSKF